MSRTDADDASLVFVQHNLITSINNKTTLGDSFLKTDSQRRLLLDQKKSCSEMLKNIDAEIENLKFLETNFNKGKKGSGFHAEKSTKYNSNRTKSLTPEDDIFHQSLASQNRRSTLGGPPREKIRFSKPRSS
jgi:hypothetical protein